MRKKFSLIERLAIAACLVGAAFISACGDNTPEPVDAKEPEPPVAPAGVTPDGTSAFTPPVIVGPVTFEDAEAAYRARRYDEAVMLFTTYTETRPENPWGFYMLGLSAWKWGDHELAEQALRTTIDLDSTHVKSRLNLGRVLMETNRHADALEQIHAAIDHDPALSEGYRLLGRAYEGLGRRDDAVWAYQEAIVRNGRDVWALNNLGTVLIREGRFEEALGPLARAVELEPGVATFQNNFGIVLERTGHVTRAAEAYRAALTADSTYAKAAVSLERVEQLTEAPAVVPLDLEEVIRRFLDLVDVWREDRATAPVG